MALTESQIQRYARHILLPEVGGKGQERLLSAEVFIAGEPEFVEFAAAYLTAAGVTCDAHSGPGLDLRIHVPSAEQADVAVALEGEAVVVRSSRCPDCRGAPGGPLPFALGRLASTLAASEVLRLILGLGEADRMWLLGGLELVAEPLRRCPRHLGPS